ncbi:unnamed protein product, partial [marine sediment metagenome]
RTQSTTKPNSIKKSPQTYLFKEIFVYNYFVWVGEISHETILGRYGITKRNYEFKVSGETILI